jgi:hypothetical protein
VEPPGSESGNTEHTWGTYNKPEAAVHPLTGPHTHKQQTIAVILNPKDLTRGTGLLGIGDKHLAIFLQ